MLDLSPELTTVTGCTRRLPAMLESRGEALGRRPLRAFADRAGNADVAEQFLLGADLAQPFVVGRRKRLAGDETGAGVGNAQLRRLLGLIVANRAAGDAGHRHRRQVYAVCARQTAMTLLDHIVAVLQGERILFVQRQRLAQGSAELALLLRRIEPRFDRGLVPD